VVSGSRDQTLKVWDLASGLELLTLAGHSGRVRGVAFDADGRRIVSGSEDRTVRIWETGDGVSLP